MNVDIYLCDDGHKILVERLASWGQGVQMEFACPFSKTSLAIYVGSKEAKIVE
jgi:hypothetical protein